MLRLSLPKGELPLWTPYVRDTLFPLSPVPLTVRFHRMLPHIERKKTKKRHLLVADDSNAVKNFVFYILDSLRNLRQVLLRMTRSGMTTISAISFFPFRMLISSWTVSSLRTSALLLTVVRPGLQM